MRRATRHLWRSAAGALLFAGIFGVLLYGAIGDTVSFGGGGSVGSLDSAGGFGTGTGFFGTDSGFFGTDSGFFGTDSGFFGTDGFTDTGGATTEGEGGAGAGNRAAVWTGIAIGVIALAFGGFVALLKRRPPVEADEAADV